MQIKKFQEGGMAPEAAPAPAQAPAQGGEEQAMQQIVQMASSQRLAGCMFLTVEALTDRRSSYSATGFYHKLNFTVCEYPNPAKGTIRMFRPLYL